MKRTYRLFPVLLAAMMLMTYAAMAQTDSAYINDARNDLGLKPNCDKALRDLDKVSATGKLTAPYFLYMAEALDCKTNREQALYYYNKYLQTDSTNDAVRKRVAELTDQKDQASRVADQERMVKASYQSSVKKKSRTKGKKKHLAIDDNYVLASVSYDAALGGANAPYKNGITFGYGGNYPIIHRHVVLGYSIYSGLLFGANNNWFSNVYQVPVSSVSGVGLGLNEGIMFTPAYVLVNKHRMAVTAGPLIGVGYIYAPDVSDDYGNAATVTNANDVALAYGGIASIFFSDYFVCSLSYTGFAGRSVTTEYGGTSQSIPVNRDMFHITFGFRFSGFDWYGWY